MLLMVFLLCRWDCRQLLYDALQRTINLHPDGQTAATYNSLKTNPLIVLVPSQRPQQPVYFLPNAVRIAQRYSSGTKRAEPRSQCPQVDATIRNQAPSNRSSSQGWSERRSFFRAWVYLCSCAGIKTSELQESHFVYASSPNCTTDSKILDPDSDRSIVSEGCHSADCIFSVQ